MMWGRSFTVASRALTSNWLYTFLNVFGLAIGLAASLLILLYVRYELTYDHWLPDSDRIYQLQTEFQINALGEKMLSQSSPYIAAVSLQKDFPEVEARVSATSAYPTIVHEGRERSAGNLMMVDGPFFDILALPFVQGDPRTALAEVGSLVLTRREAAKLFGNRPAVGQVLTFKFEETAHDYRVTGVIEDLPRNSHLDFAMLARFDAASPPPYMSFDPTYWFGPGSFQYLKLKENADVAAIRAAMPAWKRRYVTPKQLEHADWRLVGIRDIHLGEAGGFRPNADKDFLATFAIVAFLILAMACINFTNLTTARASRRAREVALRKLLGASRRQLVARFLGEALLFTAVAMLIALTLVELFLPTLSALIDADIRVRYADLTGTLLPLLGIVLLVGLASGLYPALYLSRFMPARVLKANASVSEAPGSGRLRTTLVVAQFAVSIGLIACTLIVYNQTVFARTLDPGYPRTGLLQINNAFELGTSREAFVNEARRLPGVQGVASSSLLAGRGPFMKGDLTEPGMAEPLKVDGAPVEPAFFPTMGIRLLAGRNFDPARPADDSSRPFPPDPERSNELAGRTTNILINAAGVRRYGFTNPADAIGKVLNINYAGGRDSTIIGVVADARFTGARDPILPVIFFYDRTQLPSIIVRYEGTNALVLRREIQALWRRMAPGAEIDDQFAEEAIENLYRAEEARGRIFAAFAVLAVVIASLGLFGLAAFTAERRTKEIGIRKVLGARTRDIVRLLVWQFSKPILIANLIAWPVAWWLMRGWLNGFDARIALGPGPFLLAGALALAIAVATIAGHALKVARANPVHALRYE